MQIRYFNCCGLKEIHGISSYDDPHKFMLDFVTPTEILPNQQEYLSFYPWSKTSSTAESAPPINCGFLIFTEARGKGYGKILARFILKNNLGTITESDVRVNKNSGNNLQVFVWGVDYDGLKAWREKNYKPSVDIPPTPPASFQSGLSSKPSALRTNAGVPAPGRL